MVNASNLLDRCPPSRLHLPACQAASIINSDSLGSQWWGFPAQPANNGVERCRPQDALPSGRGSPRAVDSACSVSRNTSSGSLWAEPACSSRVRLPVVKNTPVLPASRLAVSRQPGRKALAPLDFLPSCGVLFDTQVSSQGRVRRSRSPLPPQPRFAGPAALPPVAAAAAASAFYRSSNPAPVPAPTAAPQRALRPITPWPEHQSLRSAELRAAPSCSLLSLSTAAGSAGSRSAGGREPGAAWACGQLPAARLDCVGRFRFLLLSVHDSAGRQRFLLRGRTDAHESALLREATQEVNLARRRCSGPSVFLEAVATGVMAWQEGPSAHLHITVMPAGAEELAGLTASLAREVLPPHCLVTTGGSGGMSRRTSLETVASGSLPSRRSSMDTPVHSPLQLSPRRSPTAAPACSRSLPRELLGW